uniref:Ribosomal protein S13 n=1 Tax=Phaeophyceae sp. TaxID=2249243 RepID=A0A8E8U4W8_9PHAE|nr:ribosomal protein S13 [Phaeophyceae sp.]
MPFIIGTSLAEDTGLVQSVAKVYGLGLAQSKTLCKQSGFGTDSRGHHLTFDKGKILEGFSEDTPLLFGPDLVRFNKDKIRKLCIMSAYRGVRHRKGLPVRGQRTHTNSKKRPLPDLSLH